MVQLFEKIFGTYSERELKKNKTAIDNVGDEMDGAEKQTDEFGDEVEDAGKQSDNAGKNSHVEARNGDDVRRAGSRIGVFKFAGDTAFVAEQNTP